MTKIPAWLARNIEAADPATFGRHATWHTCRKCGALTLQAWDATDNYAGLTTADPLTLTDAQEAQALNRGRTTHTLTVDHGRITLHRRTVWNIRAKPAGKIRDPVIAEHECNNPVGSEMQPEKNTGPKGKGNTNDPPF